MKLNNLYHKALIKNATFVGEYDIPLIKNVDKITIEKTIPFNKRRTIKENEKKFTVIHFYIYDNEFKQILNNPEKYLNELKKFKAVIGPDFSLYRDMPISIQIMNTYLNRLISQYYQNNGIIVIPNVRWGAKDSFQFCFDGLEKGGIYAIGSYGSMKRLEDIFYFRQGLKEFIEKLKPKVVYVYGAMPNYIFDKYRNDVEFINIESYTSRIYRGDINGNR